MADQKDTKSSKTEAIKVGVRLRPFVAHEQGQKKCLLIKGNVVSVAGDGKESRKEYAVDVAMDSTDPSNKDYCSQEKCYKLMAQPLVDSILKGYNVCLFAYGQTGTGKTTTIMGKVDSPNDQGILVRMLRDIFTMSDDINRKLGSETHHTVEMIEIYNEKIKDLLAPKSSTQVPDVRVHPKFGAYMTGVTEEVVESLEQCVKLIEFGNAMKTVAATAMNSKSSRAHTIFRLKMEKRGGSDNAVVVSEVFFVDLAGRENEKSTKATGDRLVELSFINRSLMWLSQCIQSLGAMKRTSSESNTAAEKDQKRNRLGRAQTMSDFGDQDTKKRLSTDAMQSAKSQASGIKASGISANYMAKFRNSKLTLLLMNALSGNSKTAMIGTLSPAQANFEESMSTLNFAATCKNIKLVATPATEIDKDGLVKTLRDEVEELKAQLAVANRGQLPRLSMKLDNTQLLLNQFAKKWEDAKQEGEQHQTEREGFLKQVNVAKAAKIPYIANYNEDPYLAGRFAFHPAEASREYSIGHASTCDFVVPQGVGVQPVVCYFKRQHGEVRLRAARLPNGEVASIEVNGERLGKAEIEIMHHDCLVFGSSLVYYLITKNDGGLQNLPVEKLKFAHSSSAKDESNESFISAILGESTSDQQTGAKLYLDHMQSVHRDVESGRALREYLIKAERAARMVREANDITLALRKGSGLSFELICTAPILALGYGLQGMPEISVRVVRQVEADVARRRVTSERARRQSLHADLAVLKSFEGGMEGGKVDVLYIWTFTKFQERLQVMQDLYEQWTHDPSSFVLDSLTDPWREHSLGEVSQLKETYEERTGELNEKLVKRKSLDIKRRSMMAVTLPTGVGEPTPFDGSIPLGPLPSPASPSSPSCLKAKSFAVAPISPAAKPKEQLLQVVSNLKATLEHFL
mmetsp:Transcript_15676/g.36754  ORF Transcript_15676/g.36754 Transcript_15676/m.36754 type:complete len:916 (-) Transcript_15676:181-2928(-)